MIDLLAQSGRDFREHLGERGLVAVQRGLVGGGLVRGGAQVGGVAAHQDEVVLDGVYVGRDPGAGRAARDHDVVDVDIRALAEGGLGELGLPRVVGFIDPANLASARVLQAIGLQSQGLVAFPGVEGDTELFA